ncbi:MAG: hypothetical protein ACI9EQ_000146 [Bacteroidia bacterium]|jgi:hypothetical protein
MEHCLFCSILIRVGAIENGAGWNACEGVAPFSPSLRQVFHGDAAKLTVWPVLKATTCGETSDKASVSPVNVASAALTTNRHEASPDPDWAAQDIARVSGKTRSQRKGFRYSTSTHWVVQMQ